MDANEQEMTCKSVDLDGFGSPADDAWFASQTAPVDGEEKTGAHPHQVEALRRYLDGQTTSNETAAAITKPSPDDASEAKADLRDRVFGLMENALFQLPQSHTAALVALLKDIDAQDGQEEAEDGAAPLWKGLKSFGDSWSDSWKQAHWRKALSTRDPATRGRRRDAHVRRAVVEATCAVAGSSAEKKEEATNSAEDGLLPLSWGYECISDALESRDGVVWDFEVPAAAVWLRIARARLLQGAKKGETSWALEREGRLWAPGPMSEERWNFWMERMEEMKRIGNAITKAASSGLEQR
ncbi:hypothetical protein JDV02_010726 [Purpureocillium takamizusanense]|uniref:Uncharacterized protein n=1 Tax=Purpureocillium takamizusanense TaxID=2060973 RepID=A0A9Q8QR65_9HYPO|nr:uncharacterized protein JDV02_010726 [Purpureocillium takamizusanense]UNI25018.1 hypothetical protein JDV02_010726 [Purpureocillium takamizusanense]